MTAPPQDVEISGPQLAPRQLRPLLEETLGQQLPSVGRGGDAPPVGVVTPQRSLGGKNEVVDIRPKRILREERDLASPQHDRALRTDRAARDVCGLAQIRRAGLGVQMRPQRLDDLVPREHPVVGKREHLYELSCTRRLPGRSADQAITDRDFKATEQPDTDRRIGQAFLHRLTTSSIVTSIVLRHAGRAPKR